MVVINLDICSAFLISVISQFLMVLIEMEYSGMIQVLV